jgi:type IV pilus assembly protein PilE
MKRASSNGFTLIEMMIVVVIIGVLASIAYPAYNRYSTQTRRSDAKIALTQAASQQERFYSDCNWYARTPNGTRACGTAAGNADSVLGIAITSPDGHYTLGIAAGNISGGCAAYTCGFTITATPAAGGRQVGDGAFRIDALGRKEWDRNNSGTFDANENTWGK